MLQIFNRSISTLQNRDLFLTNIRFLRGGSGASSHNSLPGKLGSMVQSVAWNSECNMLAAIHDSRFSVFLYPTVIYVDRGLLGNELDSNVINFCFQNHLKY